MENPEIDLEFYEKELSELADKLANVIQDIEIANKRLSQALDINTNQKKLLNKKIVMIEQERKDQEILSKKIKELEQDSQKANWMGKLKSFFRNNTN